MLRKNHHLTQSHWQISSMPWPVSKPGSGGDVLSPSHTWVRLSHEFESGSDCAYFKIGTERSDFENRQIGSHTRTTHQSHFLLEKHANDLSCDGCEIIARYSCNVLVWTLLKCVHFTNSKIYKEDIIFLLIIHPEA